MLLAVDIGNSNVTVGAFPMQGKGALLKMWRLATDLQKTSDELGVALSAMVARERPGEKVDAVVYGSVVPSLSPVVEAAVSSYFGVRALAVTHRSPLGLRLRVDRPAEVGVDRILNALAVARLYGAPAVVLDFGTATTFDCVSAAGDYLGGAILPGPRLAARALADHTAQLPQVEIRKPRKVVGTNTVECIQAGLYTGYLGMLERVLRDTLAEMRRKTRRRIRVVATGGSAGLFAGDLPRVERVVPDLTLQGLRLAYQKRGQPCGKLRQ